MAHTVVDDIHELQLFTLATGGRVILADRHGLGFLLPILGLENRERKLHTDLIVALPQFLELLLCDVQFLSRIEVNGVDEKVGMDVFPVCVGADQNFIPLIVLSQLQRRRMSGDRIDRFAFREALHHVVEQYAADFVMQPLGSHEVRVDRFRLAVDACDQPLPIELSFLVLHGVPHHGSHMPAIFLGGGAALLKRHLSATDGLCRPLILDDVSLNAKGYERLVGQMSRGVGHGG